MSFSRRFTAVSKLLAVLVVTVVAAAGCEEFFLEADEEEVGTCTYQYYEGGETYCDEDTTADQCTFCEVGYSRCDWTSSTNVCQH